MQFLNAFAALILFFQLPIPLFWLILHPQIHFWRRHLRASYWTAGLTAWAAGAAFIAFFYRRLFAAERAPVWAVTAGFALILADLWLLRRVSRELGGARLVGLAELEGGGQLATAGLYSHIRHPRYTGMILSMLGVCLLAWTRLLAIVAGIWFVFVLAAILQEERELRARFGEAYLDYCRRVPRFLPFRFRRDSSANLGG